METNTYIFSGRVVPERALLDVSEFSFKATALGDVPEGDLFVQIIEPQVAARFVRAGRVTNILTLRNIVEEETRTLLDAVGYLMGYGYNLETVRVIRPDSSERQVFGIDVPVLVDACEQAGAMFQDTMVGLGATDGAYLRHALADLREVTKSAKDTGFFCYRAVESLKNCVAARKGVSSGKAEGWELVRALYWIDRSRFWRSWRLLIRSGMAISLKQPRSQTRFEVASSPVPGRLLADSYSRRANRRPNKRFLTHFAPRLSGRRWAHQKEHIWTNSTSSSATRPTTRTRWCVRLPGGSLSMAI